MSILEVVIIVCLVAAGTCLVFAFFALFHDTGLDETKEAVKKANDVVVNTPPAAAPGGQGLAEQTQAHAALTSGLSDYIKALAELAGNISKLRQGVAGLFMAFALLGLAGGLAAVEDKVPNKTSSKAVEAAPK